MSDGLTFAERGRRLWEWATNEFDFDPHEEDLLIEACRTVDMLALLELTIARDGLLSKTGEKVHPAVVEIRQQRIALGRLLATLRLPSGDEEENRPQRRPGVRGFYGVRNSA